jgi:hypothetical protein
MPFALDVERGETVVESQGIAHRISFSTDRIRQEPKVKRVCEGSSVKTGTRIAVAWPDSASPIIDAKARFLQIADDFSWINPHLTLSVDWNRGGEEIQRIAAANDPSWRKWRPSDPTSPHWYDEVRLSRLAAAHIAHAEDHDRACPDSPGIRERISRPERNSQSQGDLRSGQCVADVLIRVLR